MLTTRLDGTMLDNLLLHATTLRPMLKRDGLGLTELEFVLAMMLELQVVDLEQVQPFGIPRGRASNESQTVIFAPPSTCL